MANNKSNGSKKKSGSSKSAVSRAASYGSSAGRAQTKREWRGLRAYFRGVRQEFMKVVWPTREELGTSTVVVIVVCAVFAVAFWLIDTGFLALLRSVLGISMS